MGNGAPDLGASSLIWRVCVAADRVPAPHGMEEHLQSPCRSCSRWRSHPLGRAGFGRIGSRISERRGTVSTPLGQADAWLEAHGVSLVGAWSRALQRALAGARDQEMTDPQHEPRVCGTALATVVLFAVFLWTFLWGLFGAFIGVPITIVLLTFCAQHPQPGGWPRCWVACAERPDVPGDIATAWSTSPATSTRSGGNKQSRPSGPAANVWI